MKAIVVREFGGPEALLLEDVPTPQPGAGQALVRLAAIGVNFVDVHERSGFYKVPLPHPIGREGAGVVEAVGPGVTELAVGDRVAFSGSAGAYAEYVALPADRFIKVPDGVDLKLAAAALGQGMGAHYLTHSVYPVQKGDRCLIHAAAGGAGGMLVQMAKRLGATVIGTVSTEEKARATRSLGADEVINYAEQDFEAEVKRLTGGQGVQVVYDGIGKGTLEKGLRCLASRGYMVLYGTSGGEIEPLDTALIASRSLYFTRPAAFHYITTRQERAWHGNEVLGWVDSGELKVPIALELTLRDAAKAHVELAGRKTMGKVLLIP